MFQNKNYWALILGGSSGFGLASAKKLAKEGMNICIVHRDRKGAMKRIEPEFETIRKSGIQFQSFNLDALSEEGRKKVLDTLQEELMQTNGKIRTLLHSIAFGNLKLMVPIKKNRDYDPIEKLAQKSGIDKEQLKKSITELFENENIDELMYLAESTQYNEEFFLNDEDIANTIYAMGTSLYTWTKDIFNRKLFSRDARVLGLTSEGNEVAWRGYAAVSAAKVALESISRSIAYEFGPYGVRSNILQPGVTDTPALRLIPGNAQMAAHSRLRNPLGRLTTPEDVANIVYVMSLDETAWINGTIIRVDGGERIAGT